MYETHPQKTNKVATYTSAGLLIVAFVSMYFSGLEWVPYRAILQFISLAMLAASVLLLCQYVLKGYSYAIIKDEEDNLDLTVIELKRKSRITVCRISLSGIERVERVEKSDKTRISAESKGRKIYNYCVDLAPAEYICIFAEECGERLVIKLTYDEKLFALISGD